MGFLKNAIYTSILMSVSTISSVASSHHAFNMYDDSKYQKMTAVVTDYNWKNPHVTLGVEVRKGGQFAGKWVIDCSSPNILARRGWKASSLKPGDVVTVVLHPMKDGRKVGSAVSVALADGTLLKDKE